MTDDEQRTVEVPEIAAVRAAKCLKNGAKKMYQANATERADIFNGTARQLMDDSDVSWGDLDDLSYYDGPSEVLE